MTKHTPGPWAISEDGGVEVVGSDGMFIMTFDRTPAELKANASLIAAAPELLEALEGMLKGAEAMGWDTSKAHAAISKARGES